MTQLPPALQEFEARLPAPQRSAFRSFRTPRDVQDYLDLHVRYVAEPRDRAPLDVMIDGQGHCLDGSFFAALALRRVGYPALVLDLVPAPELDDDHVLALFRGPYGWGAVAKANFTGLRYREPVYRSLRELVMSYFQNYFNIDRVMTMRGYTRPFALDRFDSTGWMWDEPAAARLYKKFYSRKSIPLFPPEAAQNFHLVDDRSFQADTIGLNRDWVFGVRPNP